MVSIITLAHNCFSLKKTRQKNYLKLNLKSHKKWDLIKKAKYDVMLQFIGNVHNNRSIPLLNI